MNTDLLIGSHMSIGGGIHRAFERGASIGCTTMQVFVKNSNRWTGKALTPADIQSYKTVAGKSSIFPVVAHASYLINLCATSRVSLRRSRTACVDELLRCGALGIMGLQALSILETTAGQGTAIGYRLEHLRSIIDRVDHRERMAVCIDTCHLFAAGYPIHTENGWEKTVQDLDAVVGLDRLAVIHVNDSCRGFNSRIDRHEHIGKGKIGLLPFRLIMNDDRFRRIPKILETEKGEDLHEDVENLTVLRSLVTR